MLDTTVEKDAEIVPIYTKQLTNLIFVFFLEKDHANDVAFPFGDGRDLFPDMVHDFGLNREAFNVQYPIGRVNLRIFGSLVLQFVAKFLVNHKITDGIYIGTDAFGVANAVIRLEGLKDAGKGLLLNVFHAIRRKSTGTKLDSEKLAEIGHKMVHRRGVTLA